MLIEFPLLLSGGALMGRAVSERFTAKIVRFNAMGLFGLTFASMVLEYWMIPVSLDAAVLNTCVGVAKYVSLILAGATLPYSFRVAPLAIQGFFVGNFVWMTATIGLVYQSAPTQLCVNYLLDSQLLTGEGLVLASVITGCTWCALRGRVLLA
jgi:hypothetical protein